MKLSKKLFSVVIFSSIAITAVTGCGNNKKNSSFSYDGVHEVVTHETVSKSIGAAGGELEDKGNLKVAIPAGALTKEENITATYIEEAVLLSEEVMPAFLGAVEFGPSGTTFNKPVDVSIKLTNKPINKEISVFCYSESLGEWDYISDATINEGTATFKVDHFSRYELIDVTMDMMMKYIDLVYEKVIDNKTDSWISETYKNYLINEKNVMDYYTKYDGHYYEPIGFSVQGMYEINGQEGDPNVLNFSYGDTNKVGNKFGLANIGGLHGSKEDARKTIDGMEKKEIIDVSIGIEYKMIKPVIEYTASKTKLKKGQTSDVTIYTHYPNPKNKLYKDFPIDDIFTFPWVEDVLSVDKDILHTDATGHDSFTVTSTNGKTGSLKIMFYVQGIYGEYASCYAKFYGGGETVYCMKGTIKEEHHHIYNIDEAFSEGNSRRTVSPGSMHITVEYNFEGTITWPEDEYSFEGTIAYKGGSISVTSSKAESHWRYNGEGGSSFNDEEYRIFETVDVAEFVPTASFRFEGGYALGFGYCTISEDDRDLLPEYIAILKGLDRYTEDDDYGHYEEQNDCEYQILMGGPILYNIENKKGTQVSESETFKDWTLCAGASNPYYHRRPVEESCYEKTTQTMTLDIIN